MIFGKTKSALLAVILITAECISILFGAYRTMTEMGFRTDFFSNWAERVRLTSQEREEKPAEESEVPDLIAVPDLVGMDSDAARARLEAMGLKYVETRHYSEQYAEDTVISQNYDPETKVERGKEIWVAVSDGPMAGESVVSTPQQDIQPQQDSTPQQDIQPMQDSTPQQGEAGDEKEHSNDPVIGIETTDIEATGSENDEPETEDYSYISDTQLCILACDHFEKQYGARPPQVRIDLLNNNTAIIQLFDLVSDQEVTWDWYVVDRPTGETKNSRGERFNIITGEDLSE